MKYLKNFTKGLIVAGLAFSLAACGSPSASTGQENQAGAKAQKELKNEYASLQKEYDNLTSEKGYIEHNDFYGFENDFNLLAKSVKSSAKFEINDSEDIETQLKDLKKDINSLTEKNALKAEKRLKSPETVYKATIMEHLHVALEAADMSNNKQNELAKFQNLHGSDSSPSVDEIDKDVTSRLKMLEIFPKNRLDTFKEEIKKHKSNFSNEQIDDMNSILQNLSSSLESQASVLGQFKKFRINDGTSVEDYMDRAQTDFQDASDKVTDLESDLGVVYEEDDSY
ncbi:hypothetical protein O0Q50_19795 [Priestia aryabhattai]|uniref:Lipoprotein n=1 Tax=Priestia aryabhattai TaxID=412384 RepID=A0AAX6NCM2_PRIAR|nr:hypothetical protein [Priestia aryabhattai]MDU9693420.1 hypothetical protein [Priestia aryabhattai]